MGFQNPSIPVSATILLPISSPGKHPVRSLDSAHMTWRGSPITEGKRFLCLLELQRHILQYTFRSAMYGYTGIAIEDVGFRPLQKKSAPSGAHEKGSLCLALLVLSRHLSF